MMPKTELKDQILAVSQDYLGPAAERFIDRQIATHLGKDPKQITRADLDKLVDWIKLSFALLTKDGRLVDEYIGRLQLIAGGKPQQALGKQWTQE
jgi:hypothetical protein